MSESDTLVHHRLTDEERERLNADGFVVRPGVFSSDELTRITASCEGLVRRLIAGRRGESDAFAPGLLEDVMMKWEGDSEILHGIELFAHLSSELEAWAYDPRFIGPASDFVGDDNPVLFTEKLNLKRPHRGGANPLHQDYPFWEGIADDATRVVTAMLFLDDANVENGTLRVIPGSHKQGKVRTGLDRNIDPALDDDSAVPLKVAAGSVVFFGAFLVHKSAPNTSSKERRALLFSYQPSGSSHGRDIVRSLRTGAARDSVERA